MNFIKSVILLTSLCLSLLYCANCDVHCGGDIFIDDDHPNTTIQTPNYPELYPPSITCLWNLTAPSNRNIHLWFNTFHLAESKNCEEDSITVFDGLASDSRSLGIYCGNHYELIMQSSDNTLSVKFRSGAGEKGTGFSATIRIADCGGNILLNDNFPNTTIQSPNYPERYSRFTACFWKITAPRNHHIEVIFESIHLKEKERELRMDAIGLYDGFSSDSPILKDLIYINDHVPSIRSSGNTLLIGIVPTRLPGDTGFSAAIISKANEPNKTTSN